MYQIIFSPSAEKQLGKLERPVQERIISVLQRARTRPQDYFSKLVGHDSYKLRAGDYRIIADIEPRERIIVLKIGHRKNIYDF